MELTIENKELSELNGNKTAEFPQYASQLINWANQNAHGTRPKVIGQLSELLFRLCAKATILDCGYSAWPWLNRKAIKSN